MSLVLKDEGFDLPSPQAKFARLCGEKLHLWLSGSNNTVQIVSFANDLVSSLQTCFAESSKSRAVREKMWENYYKLRSSFEFQDMWAAFLRKSIDVKASPIFYQFITDSIMEVLIKHHFLIHMPSSKHAVSSLDYLEANALRYTAGYVVRAVKKKCMRSAHPLKDEVILCISDLEEDIGKITFLCLLYL